MPPAKPPAKLTGVEVAAHNSRDSCWIIVHGKAYDVTAFLPGTSHLHRGARTVSG